MQDYVDKCQFIHQKYANEHRQLDEAKKKLTKCQEKEYEDVFETSWSLAQKSNDLTLLANLYLVQLSRRMPCLHLNLGDENWIFVEERRFGKSQRYMKISRKNGDCYLFDIYGDRYKYQPKLLHNIFSVSAKYISTGKIL